MAGIGFELKKLFKKEGVFSTIFAGFYATAVTIGPTIIVIVALNIMYLLPPYIGISYHDKEVLSSTILYVFIFALILASPINVILSRYVADKIYEEDYGSIYSAVETGSVLIAVFVALMGIPFGIAMCQRGHLPLYYVFMSYVFFAGLSFTFYFMSFVTILKEYRKITYSFLGSLACGVLVVMLEIYVLGIGIVDAILFGLMLSFLLIAMVLFLFIKKSFGRHNQNATEILSYIKKGRWLILANAFYILGLYIHNFVFWFKSDYRVLVANVFLSAPTYDAATYLAMLSNISILVIFVVNIETKFHSAYKAYCESIIGAAGKDIRRAKQKMIETLRRETIYMVQIQVIVNIVVFLIALAVFPRIGIDGVIKTMYPVLSVGYMLLYLVQCMMIYLFYLDDQKGAPLVGLAFFAGVLIGSLIAVKLPAMLSGLGVVIGGGCGFTVAFFRIRYKLKNLDQHIYGRGKLVKQEKRIGKKDNVTLYSFGSNKKGGDFH